MKNIKVDIEKWIYERDLAYTMIKTLYCGTGESSLGTYFTYEPVVKIKGKYIVVRHGDVLNIDTSGNVISIT